MCQSTFFFSVMIICLNICGHLSSQPCFDWLLAILGSCCTKENTAIVMEIELLNNLCSTPLFVAVSTYTGLFSTVKIGFSLSLIPRKHSIYSITL